MNGPTVTGYANFLLTQAQVPAAMLPPSFVGTATVTSGSNLLDVATVTSGALQDGSVLYDALGAIPLNTAISSQASGAPGGIGEYVMAGVATATVTAPEIVSAYNDQIVGTFAVAIVTVNLALAAASQTLYALAVYNLATDRLINFAVDIPDQTFFVDTRQEYGIARPALGVVSSSSDGGTSSSWLNPERMALFTLQDLQTLKTPYGRTYMGMAQAYGPNIWGLT